MPKDSVMIRVDRSTHNEAAALAKMRGMSMAAFIDALISQERARLVSQPTRITVSEAMELDARINSALATTQAPNREG